MTEGPIRAGIRLILTAPRWRVIAILCLMLLSALTEGIGIMMLAPLLESMGGNESALGRSIKSTLSFVGLNTSVGALLIAFVVLVAFRASSSMFKFSALQVLCTT